MCHSAELDCGTGLRAPQMGRRFLRQVLDECFGPGHPGDEVRGDIALVATELLSNATRAAQHVVRLTVDVHRTWVEIAVTDDGPGRPQRREAAVTDADGRGLSIVDAIGTGWGVRSVAGAHRGNGLKSVWVRVATAEDPLRRLLCTQ
ncbi:MAG: putative sensor protein [Pseudonocardiales bacterium]|nr:putative sensor protein [Jatrophihabitantaceae bacterium]MCW2603696.1 putative sensor protein [Pseudonocardiales bacterium]